MVEGEHRLDFFGLSLPWLPVVLLYQFPVLFFLLLAATRKMAIAAAASPLQAAGDRRHDDVRRPWYSAGSGMKESYDVLEVVALYLLTVPALLLTLMITPNQSEYYKGL